MQRSIRLTAAQWAKVAFLIEHGLEPLVVTGMGIEAIRGVDSVTQDDLREFAVRVRESAPEAEIVTVEPSTLTADESLVAVLPSSEIPTAELAS